MSTQVRLNGAANRENTDAALLNDFQDKVYAASITVTPRTGMGRTKVRVAQLTGALTLNLGVGSAAADPQVGDEMEVWFSCDGTIRTVTFGTGITAVTGTLALAINKTAHIKFFFNGTNWQEVSRAIATT